MLLFFKIALAVLSALHFLMNFRISLPVSIKEKNKSSCDFNRDCIESVEHSLVFEMKAVCLEGQRCRKPSHLCGAQALSGQCSSCKTKRKIGG